MTTQEAKIRSNIPRKTHDQTTTELYFPHVRSTYHSIFSGNNDVCDQHIPKSGTVLVSQSDRYKKAIKASKSDTDLPIKVEFTATGIDFAVIKRGEDQEGNPTSDVMVFNSLNWIDDAELLTTIAKLCDKVNIDCVRTIPTLAADFQNFKSIYQIETNPIFDFMAFTYALFHKLKMIEAIPKCYVQVLMGRRKTTYMALVQAVKYKTILPDSVLEWFEKDIIKEKPYTFKHDEDKTTETINVWSLLLIDYAGKAFNHQLKLQVGPKNASFENSRIIPIVTDESVCPLVAKV